MDSLTQMVLGAAVGEAVAGKKIRNKAPLYGAIAGTIPDMDVFLTGWVDYSSALLFHRGISHSLLFALLLAWMLSSIIVRFESHKQAKDWFWLFFLGFATHAFFDAQTTWGVQLLWPLEARFALDSIFIIDPFYTLPISVFLLLAIFKKRTPLLRSRLNNIGLLISSLYLILGIGFKALAFQKFETALAQQGIAYENLNTRPSPMNIILWSANVETKDAYLMGHYSLFDTQPIVFHTYRKQHRLPDDWQVDLSFEQMVQFTEGWYLITQDEEGVYFNDLRSGTYSFNNNTHDFVFTYKVDKDEKGSLSFTRMNTTPKDLGALTKELLKRIKGN